MADERQAHETRKFDAIDDLLGKLDSIAREYDGYEYGLPMAMDSAEYAQMREAVEAMSSALRARVHALEEGLRSSRNETSGMLKMANPELRQLLGNTNVRCLQNRVNEAERLLAEGGKG